VQNTARRPKTTVSADEQGLVSEAGVLLPAKAARVTGLDQGLTSGLARWRAPQAVHDPGKILTDLVVTLALGGDCPADVAVLRAQPELCGPVASDTVISRLVSALAADAPRARTVIRKARGCGLGAGRRARSGRGREPDPGGPRCHDRARALTEGESHSYLEEDVRIPSARRVRRPRCRGGGEPLAILLRAGNAGPNTAAEHIAVTRLALAQLPRGEC
jgi:Transposase DDE domain group 1